jgi:hypothetical protein
VGEPRLDGRRIEQAGVQAAFKPFQVLRPAAYQFRDRKVFGFGTDARGIGALERQAIGPIQPAVRQLRGFRADPVSVIAEGFLEPDY